MEAPKVTEGNERSWVASSAEAVGASCTVCAQVCKELGRDISGFRRSSNIDVDPMGGLIKNPQRGSELRCILRGSSTIRQLDECCANRERTRRETRVIAEGPQLLLDLNT